MSRERDEDDFDNLRLADRRTQMLNRSGGGPRKDSARVRGRKKGTRKWRVWKNQQEAARDIGVFQNEVSLVCNNKRLSAGGWVFEYIPQTLKWREVSKPVTINGIAAVGYYVTSLGRFKSPYGDYFDPATSANLEKFDSYASVVVNGKKFLLHRLICEAFHGPPPDGHVCDHIDREKR